MDESVEQQEPNDSKINVVRSSAIMSIGMLMSRILGIVRELVINWQFGQNAATDAYRLAFSIPDLLFYLIASGALSSAFIPVFGEYLHSDREEDAWKIFSAVSTIMSLIVIVLIGAAWIFALPLAHIVAKGKPDETIQLVSMLSRVLLPCQFAFLIGGLMIGTLYSRQVFTVPVMAPNIYNLGLIFGALIISHFVSPAVLGITFGGLFGAIIGSLVIPIYTMMKLGSKWNFSLDFKHPGVVKVFKLMGPVVLGLSLPAVFPIFLRYCSTYYPAGTTSAIENANQLMQAPLGIFGQAMALAVFPALTQVFAQKNMAMYPVLVSRTLNQVLYFAMPSTAVLMAAPAPIIKLLFEHGKFTSADTERTALALTAFSFGIVAWCMQPVLMRSFFAVQKTITPVILGTITTVIFLAMCTVVLKNHLEFWMFPACTSLAAFILLALMMTTLKRTIEGFHYENVGITAAKAGTASAIFGLALWIIGKVMMSSSFVTHKGAFIGTLVVLLGLFVIGYYKLTKAMQLKEAEILGRALGRMGRVIGMRSS